MNMRKNIRKYIHLKNKPLSLFFLWEREIKNLKNVLTLMFNTAQTLLDVLQEMERNLCSKGRQGRKTAFASLIINVCSQHFMCILAEAAFLADVSWKTDNETVVETNFKTKFGEDQVIKLGQEGTNNPELQRPQPFGPETDRCLRCYCNRLHKHKLLADTRRSGHMMSITYHKLHLWLFNT